MKRRVVGTWWLLVVCLLVAMPVLGQDGGLTIAVHKRFGYNMGSQIQGSFSIKARGPEDLATVTFTIDGAPLATMTAPPFEAAFQTRDYDLGWHEIAAEGTTAGGEALESPPLRFQFVSPEAVTKGMVRLLVPVLILIVGAIVLSAVVPLFTGRNKQPRSPEAYTPGEPRSYGMFGGTVCPKCGRPFGLHWWGLNVGLFSKYDRCPHCGKWSLVRRASREALVAAEAAESAARAATIAPPQLTEEEALREQLEDSRYTEL